MTAIRAMAFLALLSSSGLAQFVTFEEGRPDLYQLDPDDYPEPDTQLQLPGMVKHSIYRRDDGDDIQIYVHNSYTEPNEHGQHIPVFKRAYIPPIVDDGEDSSLLHKRDVPKPADGDAAAKKIKEDKEKEQEKEKEKQKEKDAMKVHVVDFSDFVKYEDIPRPPSNATNATTGETTRKECADMRGQLECVSAKGKDGGDAPLRWRCRVAFFGGNPFQDKWVKGDEGKCEKSDTEEEKAKKAAEEKKKKEEEEKKKKEAEEKKKKEEEEKKKKEAEEKDKKKLPKFENGGRCGMSTFKNQTTSKSAYTGGCKAIQDWASKRLGKWAISAKIQGDINLIVAGSNSGANCRFVIRNNNEHKTFIGTADVRDLVRDARVLFQVTYSNTTGVGERMGAEGHMKCDKQYLNGTKFEQKVDWAILPYDGPV